MNENLKLEVNGEDMTITLKGRISALVTDDIIQEVIGRLEGVKHVYMDIRDVDYISSAGLGFILIVQNEIDDIDGGSLKVSGASDMVMSVFESTGFLNFLDVEE